MSAIAPSDRVWALARAEVLAHEGGFVNHPADPGGATNRGVSLRLLRSLDIKLGDVDGDGDVDVDDIKALTPDDAAELFHLKFWGPAGCDKIAPAAPVLAVKLFDMAVNMGVPQAVKLLQRSINAFCDGTPVADDGVMGPITLSAINTVDVKALTAELCRAQRQFYINLTEARTTLLPFMAGWLKRAAWVPDLRDL